MRCPEARLAATLWILMEKVVKLSSGPTVTWTQTRGGWTIVWSTDGQDDRHPIVSDAPAFGNAVAFDSFNLTRAQKLAVNTLSSESLFVRSDGPWLKADLEPFHSNLAMPNFHVSFSVQLTSSDGQFSSAYMGHTNFNISGGDDCHISVDGVHRSLGDWSTTEACSYSESGMSLFLAAR